MELFGKNYYIDIDGITDKCRTTQSVKNDDESEDVENSDGSIEINIFKYEMIKMCLERVLSEYEEDDESMGVFGKEKTPMSFKIAFNTLIKYGIIIEEEDE
jgi:hypothetical protein